MPEDMTVMVVDGGARGHVLSEAYENDPRIKRIIVAHGNDFMKQHRIPSPRYRVFSSGTLAEAARYADSIYDTNPDALLYVKASGLCGGKGALRCENLREALDNIARMETFGEAGRTFVIEEGLTGEEFSYTVISDGNVFYEFKPAQDNKLSGNFDTGNQTGGMGANAPAMAANSIPYYWAWMQRAARAQEFFTLEEWTSTVSRL